MRIRSPLLVPALAAWAWATSAHAQTTERLLLTEPPLGSPVGFGPGAWTVGDVDGDALADIAVTAGGPNVYPTPAGSYSGRVLLFSGVSGAFLHELVNTVV